MAAYYPLQHTHQSSTGTDRSDPLFATSIGHESYLDTTTFNGLTEYDISTTHSPVDTSMFHQSIEYQSQAANVNNQEIFYHSHRAQDLSYTPLNTTIKDLTSVNNQCLPDQSYATTHPVQQLEPCNLQRMERAIKNTQSHPPQPMSDDVYSASQTTYITPSSDDNLSQERSNRQQHNVGQYMEFETTNSNGDNALLPSWPINGSDHFSNAMSQPTALRLDTSMLSNTASRSFMSNEFLSDQQSALASNQNVAKSPILKIDTCEDLLPATSSHREVKHSRRRSTIVNGHLSPYLEDDQYSIPSLHDSQYALSGHGSLSDNEIWPERNTGGLSPVDRQMLSNQFIPSLNEQETQRNIADKNADIEGWLDLSAHSSELEATRAATPPQSRYRPRSRSTNDIALMQRSHHSYEGKTHLDVPELSTGDISHESRIESSNQSDIECSTHTCETSDSGCREQAEPGQIVDLRQNKHDEPNHWLWGNESAGLTPTYEQSLPLTGNAAIMSWHNTCAKKETYEASITATINTLDSARRRRSISDFGSLCSQSGISRNMTIDSTNQKKGISGYFQGILPMRASSRGNGRKRKNEQDSASTNPTVIQSTQQLPTSYDSCQNSNPGSRPRTPKPVHEQFMGSPGNRSPMLAAASARLTKIRNRSKSELGSRRSPGLTDLWKQSGGPPVGFLAVPTNNFDSISITSNDSKNNDCNSAEDEDALFAGLEVRLDMTIIPNYDGFRNQITTLNPAMDERLLDRFVNEQVQRYRRLVDAKIEHEKRARQGKCGSHRMCAVNGGQPQPIVPKAGLEGSPSPIFLVTIETSASERAQMPGDPQTANFRQGVPRPPAQSLPARFECSYCYQVKDIHKPSDWTKHVDEDVQPFTCTFPDCSEPRSFKRKADWVRHEREKHRHPEVWTCKFEQCKHECFRRDNFVQHLIREHSIPDPKIRTGRSSGARSLTWSPSTPVDFGTEVRYFTNDKDVGIFVNQYVDFCRSLVPGDAAAEPCRFCGLICQSLKDLSVHLAKHMEQIALPVLALVQEHAGLHEPSLAIQEQQIVASAAQRTGQPTFDMKVSSEPYLFDEPRELDQTPAFKNVDYTLQGSSISSYTASQPAFSPINQFGQSMIGESYRPITFPMIMKDLPTSEALDVLRHDNTHPQLSVWPDNLGNGNASTLPTMILSDLDHFGFDSSAAQQQAGHSSQQHEYFMSLSNFST